MMSTVESRCVPCHAPFPFRIICIYTSVFDLRVPMSLFIVFHLFAFVQTFAVLCVSTRRRGVVIISVG